MGPRTAVALEDLAGYPAQLSASEPDFDRAWVTQVDAADPGSRPATPSIEAEP